MKATAALVVMSTIAMYASNALGDPPVDGLVAEYLFNGNAEDSGPFGIDGAIQGAEPTTDRFGRPDNAYRFNGSNSYIEMADNDVFSVSTTGQLTISVWMRPDVLTFPTSQSSGYTHWMGKGDGGGSHEWVFRIYDLENAAGRPNRTSFYLFNLDGGLGAGSYEQEPLTTGEWIHYVAVSNTDTDYITWYKNGTLRDTDAIYNSSYQISPENGGAPVRIGTRDFGSFFEGALDDIRFYNRALTQSEISELWLEEYATRLAPRAARKTVAPHRVWADARAIVVSSGLTESAPRRIRLFSPTGSLRRSVDVHSGSSPTRLEGIAPGAWIVSIEGRAMDRRLVVVR